MNDVHTTPAPVLRSQPSFRSSSLRGIMRLNVDTKLGSAAAIAAPASTKTFVPGAPPDQASIDYIARHVKLVVFDFDQCILAIHAFALKIEASAVQGRVLEADFTDLAFFTSVVRLLRNAGVHIAIASFGRYEVIQAYMDRAFGIEAGNAESEAKRLFDRTNISTPSCVGVQDGWAVPGGKNPQLAALAAHYHVPLSSVLFFDDDPSNIDSAFDGGVTFSVNCPQGFDGMAWAKAMEIVTVHCHSCSHADARGAGEGELSAGARLGGVGGVAAGLGGPGLALSAPAIAMRLDEEDEEEERERDRAPHRPSGRGVGALSHAGNASGAGGTGSTLSMLSGSGSMSDGEASTGGGADTAQRSRPMAASGSAALYAGGGEGSNDMHGT